MELRLARTVNLSHLQLSLSPQDIQSRLLDDQGGVVATAPDAPAFMSEMLAFDATRQDDLFQLNIDLQTGQIINWAVPTPAQLQAFAFPELAIVEEAPLTTSLDDCGMLWGVFDAEGVVVAAPSRADAESLAQKMRVLHPTHKHLIYAAPWRDGDFAHSKSVGQYYDANHWATVGKLENMVLNIDMSNEDLPANCGESATIEPKPIEIDSFKQIEIDPIKTTTPNSPEIEGIDCDTPKAKKHQQIDIEDAIAEVEAKDQAGVQTPTDAPSVVFTVRQTGKSYVAEYLGHQARSPSKSSTPIFGAILELADKLNLGQVMITKMDSRVAAAAGEMKFKIDNTTMQGKQCVYVKGSSDRMIASTAIGTSLIKATSKSGQQAAITALLKKLGVTGSPKITETTDDYMRESDIQRFAIEMPDGWSMSSDQSALVSEEEPTTQDTRPVAMSVATLEALISIKHGEAESVDLSMIEQLRLASLIDGDDCITSRGAELLESLMAPDLSEDQADALVKRAFAYRAPAPASYPEILAAINHCSTVPQAVAMLDRIKNHSDFEQQQRLYAAQRDRIAQIKADQQQAIVAETTANTRLEVALTIDQIIGLIEMSTTDEELDNLHRTHCRRIEDEDQHFDLTMRIVERRNQILKDRVA